MEVVSLEELKKNMEAVRMLERGLGAIIDGLKEGLSSGDRFLAESALRALAFLFTEAILELDTPLIKSIHDGLVDLLSANEGRGLLDDVVKCMDMLRIVAYLIAIKEPDRDLVSKVVKSDYRMRIVELLYERRSLSPTQIARELFPDLYEMDERARRSKLSLISQVLRGMEEDGLIAHMADGKTRIYFLTGKGFSVARSLFERRVMSVSRLNKLLNAVGKSLRQRGYADLEELSRKLDISKEVLLDVLKSPIFQDILYIHDNRVGIKQGGVYEKVLISIAASSPDGLHQVLNIFREVLSQLPQDLPARAMVAKAVWQKHLKSQVPEVSGI
ncbi:MAG: hypothetical protein DRJ69_00390 [Thermoprotei archaeon]|nr:MAG: hypothetical protein DRJ69_00390 [Thermoprotei archaeon]